MATGLSPDGLPHPAHCSETLAAIKALRVVVERFSLRHVALPVELASARMLHALGAAEASPTPPPADFLEEVRRNLVAASRSGQFSPRDLRYAPLLLWNGDPPAASLPHLIPKLLEQANMPGKTLHRLIAAYLRDFEPDAPWIKEATAKIREELAKGGPRLDTWRTAQNEAHLFEPARGPAALADLLLESGQNPDDILTRFKFSDPLLATGKYMLGVEDAVRAQVPQLLRESGRTGLNRVLQILAPSGRLRFDARKAHTGRALLKAWLDRGAKPALALQDPIRRTLLHWLGDPRLPSGSQRWAAVGEQETALMRRSLTRASLDLFFKLIDQHALDAHWRYRHAFWLAYLEKGAIADAWLALGSQTYNEASAIRELNGAYGQLRGGDPKQSALLLRIGPLVIGEFTHNGKLRVWPAEWSKAPQLGRQTYARNDLTGKCLPFPPNPYRGRGGDTTGRGLSHISSHNDYWQGSAAALLERHAGIRITRSDWRPK